MEKALKEGAESARLYATRFLGLLMRSRAPNVTQWVMRLLVSQVCCRWPFTLLTRRLSEEKHTIHKSISVFSCQTNPA